MLIVNLSLFINSLYKVRRTQSSSTISSPKRQINDDSDNEPKAKKHKKK